MDNIEISHKITQFMAQIGISRLETDIYLKLLEQGATSVTDLAKKMKMARTTVFENTEKLIENGLVTRTVRGKRKLLLAEEPGKVKSVVDAKEVELVSRQKELDVVKSGLDGFVKSVMEMVPEANQRSSVAVRFYEGKEEVKNLYIKMSKTDEAYSFANVDKYYEIFSGPDNVLWEAFDKNPNRKVWDILVDTPFARKNSTGHKRYFCKYIPHSEIFSGFDVLMYGDYVAVVQLELVDVMAIEIKSTLLAKSIKGLHIAMWELLPEL